MGRIPHVEVVQEPCLEQSFGGGGSDDGATVDDRADRLEEHLGQGVFEKEA